MNTPITAVRGGIRASEPQIRHIFIRIAYSERGSLEIPRDVLVLVLVVVGDCGSAALLTLTSSNSTTVPPRPASP